MGKVASPPIPPTPYPPPTPPMRSRQLLAIGCLSLCTTLSPAIASGDDAVPSADAAGVDFFERKIRPVLVEHCERCHGGGDSIRGGLRVDSRDGLQAGGDSGPAIVAGDPDASELIAAIRYESFEMPPKGRLPEETIADFVRWIEMGAPDPREQPGGGSSGGDGANGAAAIDWQLAAEHWSFIPPRPMPPPELSNTDRIRTRVDPFILARLESAGLSPNEEANRRVLLRRVSLDLTGIPPSYDQVEAFVADESTAAYQRAVDRLLASVHHGEHWARLWLDLARYAEDQAHIVGNNKQLFYPNAYLYRDWVIEAFNDDMPYDRFVRLQLAADLIAPDDTDEYPALGFIGLGPKYYRRGSPEVMADEWEDRVDTVSRGLLGLTVACARCHDHKYDPVPTEDYYALAGVFASTEMFNRPLDSEVDTKDDGQAKDPERSMHVIREAKPRDLNVMIRGDVNNEGAAVERGFVSVLSGGTRETFRNGSGRLQLAQVITDRDNPLTARVIVNRVWGRYFGEPLVDTPSNFGALGSEPTHPELLDDLASRFMENGWSLKWLHREIVLSATYRQSSRLDADKHAVDPANRLLWRVSRRRLTAEAWRDSLLLAGGSLEREVGGRSMRPSDPDERRRTVYSTVSRFQLDPFLASVDFPDPNTHAERRSETTTPLQKLFALNGELIVRQSHVLAERLIDSADDRRERVVAAYRAVFARDPDDAELQLAFDYLSRGDDPRQAWAEYAQALLASNELLIVD